MSKSDAAGGIRSGRRFARSSNIVDSLEPRGDREELLREVLLDARLTAPVRREIIDVICGHGRTIVAAIIGINQSSGRTRLFCARRRLADPVRAQGIAGAATGLQPGSERPAKQRRER